ncbi:MAG: hypothetical protein IT342_04560 [Candidatus Melainabacteria bacterium]|nr:hypothetical protein [Candidatus Melainabacteria bacterium]
MVLFAFPVDVSGFLNGQVEALTIGVVAYSDNNFSDSKVIVLPYARDDTMILVKTAIQAIRDIQQKGYSYQKAAVFLGKVQPKEGRQVSLFAPIGADEKSEKMMKALDAALAYFSSKSAFAHRPVT